MVRILLYVKELRSNVKGELLIPLSDTQTSRSWNYWFERIRALLASLVEELPIVIWPLVIYGSRFMVQGFMATDGSRFMVQG